MKTILIFMMMCLLGISSSFACTVCKKEQPEFLRGFIHGAGPASDWDYLIVGISVAVVVGTFMLSARYLIKPGETNQSHIKNSILNAESYEGYK